MLIEVHINPRIYTFETRGFKEEDLGLKQVKRLFERRLKCSFVYLYMHYQIPVIVPQMYMSVHSFYHTRICAYGCCDDFINSISLLLVVALLLHFDACTCAGRIYNMHVVYIVYVSIV